MPVKGQKTKRNEIVFYDSPEQIKKCQKCILADCQNCMERRRERYGASPFDWDLLYAYGKYETDKGIARALHTFEGKVKAHRELLGLPDPATTPLSERKKIIERKLS